MRKFAEKIAGLLSFTILILFAASINFVYAETGAQKPTYAPQEVLVGFKEGVDPEAVLQKANIAIESIQRVHSIEPAVSSFKKDWKLEKDSDGWYAFLGKNYKEIEEIPDEEIFAQAYQRMSPTEKKLYRSFQIKIPKELSVEEVVASLKRVEGVEYAEPNYLSQAFYVPNDPSYPQQWAHKNTHAEQAWNITMGDPSVVITIIDTGIDYTHEDLAQNIWRDESGNPGKDFVDIDTLSYQQAGYYLFPEEDYTQIDNDPDDVQGHGTYVSGIAAAVADNNKGVAGACPRARIMSVRAGFKIHHPQYGPVGMFEYDDIAQAIQYAADNGAKIISMSFGGSAESQTLKNALDYASSPENGVVLIAAAGNNNSDTKSYPAGYNNVIAVGANDSNDQRSIWGFNGSNYGFWVDVFAPGTDILSTFLNNQYALGSGTSAACPYVAGLAALILSRHLEFSSQEVRSILRASADDIGEEGFDVYTAYGRINCANALAIDEPCIALISSPEPASQLFKPASLEILGTASGAAFTQYILEAGFGLSPQEWTLVSSSSQPVINGMLGDFSNNNSEGPLTFRLTVMNSNQQKFQAYSRIDLFRTLHDGWPVDFSFFESPAALGDLDGDKIDDIVFLAGQSILAIEHNGLPLANWKPIRLTDLGGRGYKLTNPAVGNIDEDQDLEVVVGTRDGALFAFDKNGMMEPGWPPVSLPVDYKLISEQPILIDLDGDGACEIVGGFSTNSADLVCAFRGDGSAVEGWPKQLPLLKAKNIVLAGIKNSEGADIAVMQLKGYHDSGEIVLMIFNNRGQMLPGWPYYLPRGEFINLMPASIAVGDILEDNGPELIFATSYYYNTTSYHKRIHALRYDGTPAVGWPINADGLFSDQYGELNNPVLGDLDNDKKAEVIVTTADSDKDKIAVFKDNGSIYWAYGLQSEGSSMALVADVDGDAFPDVVVAGKGAVYALNKDGGLIPGWPKSLPGHSVYSPTIGDVDGDAKLELLVGGGANTSLFLYDLEGPNDPKTLQWPMFCHDSQRSGYLAQVVTNNVSPAITIITPMEGGLYREDNLTVSGNVIDDTSRINSVFIQLDAQNAQETPVDINGDFSYTLTGLAGGSHEIIVTARDDDGGIGSIRVPFTIDFPPEVSISYPAAGAGAAVPSTGFVFKGTASEWSGKGLYIFAEVYDFGRDKSTGYKTPAYNAAIKEWSLTVLPEYISAGAQARLTIIANDGIDSTVKAVTVNVVSLPAAPSNLTASLASSTQVRLSWKDNSNNETGFKIERSINGITFTPLASVAADFTSYLDTSVSAGRIYLYRVRAYNAIGDSGYSNTVFVITRSSVRRRN